MSIHVPWSFMILSNTRCGRVLSSLRLFSESPASLRMTCLMTRLMVPSLNNFCKGSNISSIYSFTDWMRGEADTSSTPNKTTPKHTKIGLKSFMFAVYSLTNYYSQY
uniref:Uncharacterized protein n=1 Tax=Cacopsylla melanoneura TaxID=428564 RepID=A0A8D8SYA7_9HEMI